MNLNESTIMNAIRHSMSKNCFANVILAGPVSAGKREMAQMISKWLNFVNSAKIVSIFSEEDYYKDFSLLLDNKFGVKDVEAKDVFDLEHFFEDAKFFVEREFEYEKVSMQAARAVANEKISYIYGVKPKGKVSIFTGPHAIELIQSGEIHVPKPIYIFMNADLQKCIQRRMQKGFMVPNIPIGSKEWDEYFDYVISQNERYILPQKERADIVLKCD